jgi:tRNA-splicing ligase RtcB
MKVVLSENKPIKMWLDDIEESALEQARNLANLPFIYRHVALMPDCHMGYGMPIGGVIATKGVVIPNAVGVDIGCGMVACKSDILAPDDTDVTKAIMQRIRNTVPVGFNHHDDKCDGALMPELPEYRSDSVIFKEYQSARSQLGTLGGGNHFIELQKDSDGYLWIMIHSGSRNLGYKVAKYHNDLAKDLNSDWFSCVPREWDLAFLPLGTVEANNYLEEMDYCLKFAFSNRQKMLEACIRAIMREANTAVNFGDQVNIHHNYASMENHGENVMVHRKGATRARKGELGIIPGSQGTKSYIVRGLGNKASFESCSHGAGRKMGRKQAKRELSLDEQKALLDSQGIVHGIRTENELDEAPGAYKDISVVMGNQRDLVEIVTDLTPIAVIKG